MNVSEGCAYNTECCLAYKRTGRMLVVAVSRNLGHSEAASL